jgi:hypothetical protein
VCFKAFKSLKATLSFFSPRAGSTSGKDIYPCLRKDGVLREGSASRDKFNFIPGCLPTAAGCCAQFIWQCVYYLHTISETSTRKRCSTPVTRIVDILCPKLSKLLGER